MKNLSIIIPCKNEENYIGKLLDNIKNQNLINFEIIIADANSTDNTLNIINSYKKHLNINVIEGGLPGIGRNNGCKMSNSDILLFIDADVTFTDNNFINKCLNVIFKYEMISTTPKYKGNFDILAYIIYFLNNIFTSLISLKYPFAIGAFTMIKKEKFEEIGMYNEKVHQCEDWLLSKQIKPKNFKLFFQKITQDNRRFKKFGYIKMLKLIYNNWKNRNNIEYFYKDVKYF